MKKYLASNGVIREKNYISSSYDHKRWNKFEQTVQSYATDLPDGEHSEDGLEFKWQYEASGHWINDNSLNEHIESVKGGYPTRKFVTAKAKERVNITVSNEKVLLEKRTKLRIKELSFLKDIELVSGLGCALSTEYGTHLIGEDTLTRYSDEEWDELIKAIGRANPIAEDAHVKGMNTDLIPRSSVIEAIEKQRMEFKPIDDLFGYGTMRNELINDLLTLINNIKP